MVSQVEFEVKVLNLKILKKVLLHDISQFVTGNEVKVPIYPLFRAAKFCQNYLRIADMINFIEDIFAAVPFR